MSNRTLRGRFITLEGGEGTGKSTQARRLAERLRRHGQEVVLTREPGGSPGAEAVRHVILSGAIESLGPAAEAMMFAAARADHVATRIKPALEAGSWVVCDRFTDSTRVYQGDLGGVDEALLSVLERVAVNGVRPDLTVILDLPAEEGLKRAGARRAGTDPDAVPDRFEKETIEAHETIRAAFRRIAEAEPDRCVIVDATGDEDAVAEAVWAALAERLLPEASS